jgi:hypothetical protein
MHSAIRRSCAIVFAEGGGPEPGGPLPGTSFSHFVCAASNAGAAGLDPMGISPPCPGFGSGKLGTPLARMHLANASGPEPPAPGAAECEPVAPPLAAVVDPAVVDPAVVAPPTVVWLGALPPHPATRIPLTSVATTSSRAGGKRVGLCVSAGRHRAPSARTFSCAHRSTRPRVSARFPRRNRLPCTQRPMKPL